MLAAAALTTAMSGCARNGPATADSTAGGEPQALRRGELLSYACQACHTLGAEQPTLIGPNLHGVFGRVAGTQPDFEYSDALRASGIVWSVSTLEQWLASPSDYLPGTTMVFAGYADPADRYALLEYLVTATGESTP